MSEQGIDWEGEAARIAHAILNGMPATEQQVKRLAKEYVVAVQMGNACANINPEKLGALLERIKEMRETRSIHAGQLAMDAVWVAYRAVVSGAES